MGNYLTYARAVKIYNVMTNPVQTKAIVLMPDGTCEYFDLGCPREFKQMLKYINFETEFYDVRPNGGVSWKALCKYYNAHPIEDTNLDNLH